MKIYILYAVLLYGAFYAGNRRQENKVIINQQEQIPATGAVNKKTGKISLPADSMAAYKGLQPAGIFMLE